MKTKKAGTVYIGTSNIVIPGNKQSFPEAFRDKSRLHYYASLFNTVEINSSFYKVPMPSTFEKWTAEVPAGFKFSIKLWKAITHVKELDCLDEDIDKFLMAMDRSGKHKGPLLIQFPGKISIDFYNKVEHILQRIFLHNNKMEMAVEFRHPGWYVGETMELLDEFNASLVLHDIPKSKNLQLNKKATFVYLRFHGTAGDYRGSYTTKELKYYAALIKKWAAQGKNVYAYFNNTMGAAYDNACSLQGMV